MEAFLKTEFLGNTVRAYLLCLGLMAAGILLAKVVQVFLLRRLRRAALRTESELDDFVVTSVDRNLLPLVYLWVIIGSLRGLELSPLLHRGLKTFGTVLTAAMAVRLVLLIARFSLKFYWLKKERAQSEAGEKSLNGIFTLLQLVVWALAAILVLDNLGVKVSTFVAGLGITGIAVALAAQTVLGDLFGYFVIFFDEPFKVGDFIKVDAFMGTVEHIGIKTTRVRSLEGEEIIFSNKNLTDSRVQNYKRLLRRRQAFTVGVVYHTPNERLREIPDLLRALIEAQAEVTFDRAHFKGFGDSSLDFEAVYFVENPDYNRFMDIQQAINLGLKEAFEARGLEFAFPSRTVYTVRENGGEKCPSLPAKSA